MTNNEQGISNDQGREEERKRISNTQHGMSKEERKENLRSSQIDY